MTLSESCNDFCKPCRIVTEKRKAAKCVYLPVLPRRVTLLKCTKVSSSPVHTTPLTNCCARVWKRTGDIECVWSFRGKLFYRRVAGTGRRVLDASDQLNTQDTRMIAGWVERYWHPPKDMARYIRLGARLPGHFRFAAPPLNNWPVVLFHGRIAARVYLDRMDEKDKCLRFYF